MTATDEAQIGEFYNDGTLWTPTVVDNWDRPLRVELKKAEIPANRNQLRLYKLLRGKATHDGDPPKYSELLFKSNAEDAEPRKANPPSELLERFLSLSDGSDETILKFATKFGPLAIYSEPASDDDIEFCDVWRYFARAMLALLKIAAQANAQRPGSKEDWDTIGSVPQIIADQCSFYEDAELRERHEDEYTWFLMTRFVARGSDRDRKMLVRFLDRLLALGKVRPWVRWPKNTLRPRLIYSSPGLLPYLALRLCLRVTKMDAFALCAHCQKEYAPSERAPKTGQRNFCPQCRDEGIPKKYALSDYRKRKRSVAHGTKETRTK